MLHHSLPALALVAALGLVTGCSDGEPAGPESTPVAAPSVGDPDAGASPDDELWSEETAAPSGATAVACEEAPREAVPTGDGWRHPDQSFYDGTEAELPSASDLEHLMEADAAAVVRYRADRLPDASLEALRTWSQTTAAVVALPHQGADRPAVTVDLGGARLSCDGLDTLRLDAFVAEREPGAGHDH